MVATTISYIVMTIAMISILGFSATAAPLFLAAQNVPAAYNELNTVAYIAIQEMLNAYRATSVNGLLVHATVTLPLKIAGNSYTITISGLTLQAQTGNLKRTFTLPSYQNAVWLGTFKSGSNRLQVITALNLQDAIQVIISN
jgi:hypothetical protein